jgi:predicted Zn-dependent protease with MMP-like domain
MQMSRSEFERLVGEALDSLPDEFARLVDNVAVIVEEEPTEEDLELLDDEELEDDDEVDDADGELDDDDDDDSADDDHDHEELLGIFRGVPLTQRAYDSYGTLPTQIAIFRGPILRVARDRSEALREIRETVIHELGHYFGLDDETMVF